MKSRLALTLFVSCLYACSNTDDSITPAPAASSSTTLESFPCPQFEKTDYLESTKPRPQGPCSVQGGTCVTNQGTVSCRGFEGPTGIAEELCTCDGTTWYCGDRFLGKGNACPVSPCDALANVPTDQVKTGLLYCSDQSGACEVDGREACPNGAQGQTIKWSCACDLDSGSYSCTPSPQGDAACP